MFRLLRIGSSRSGANKTEESENLLNSDDLQSHIASADLQTKPLAPVKIKIEKKISPAPNITSMKQAIDFFLAAIEYYKTLGPEFHKIKFSGSAVPLPVVDYKTIKIQEDVITHPELLRKNLADSISYTKAKIPFFQSMVNQATRDLNRDSADGYPEHHAAMMAYELVAQLRRMTTNIYTALALASAHFDEVTTQENFGDIISLATSQTATACDELNFAKESLDAYLQAKAEQTVVVSMSAKMTKR